MSVDDIKEAREAGVQVATVQNHYNLVNRTFEDVVDYCEQENIGFIPWFPIASGQLAEQDGPLKTIAADHDATAAQLSLAWLLKRSPVIIPIPGTSSVKHLEENTASAGIELSDEEFAALDAAAATRRVRAMPRALLVIDIQNDYFPGGAFPLHEPEAAAAATAQLLGSFRAGGEPIIHIQHVWDAPEADFMVPGTPGVEINAVVAPMGEEPVIQKAQPNAFLGTGLQDRLVGSGIDELVVAGMMTSMCVDATVRAASDLGFSVTLVHDACAAPALSFGGVDVAAEAVQAAFLAPLADEYATVVSVAELLAHSEV